MVYYIIKQEITQEITVRSIFYICWLGLKIRKSGFPMDLKGFETLWSHRRPAGDGQRSTGPLHGMVRIPFPGKNEAHPFGCASFLVDLKGFETLWSHRRPAGDGQRSTGPLHGMVRIPFPGKNEAHPFGCASFLVDLKGFEPSTPTMRMWCAPSCATSPYLLQLTGILYIRFPEMSSEKMPPVQAGGIFVSFSDFAAVPGCGRRGR